MRVTNELLRGAVSIPTASLIDAAFSDNGMGIVVVSDDVEGTVAFIVVAVGGGDGS